MIQNKIIAVRNNKTIYVQGDRVIKKFFKDKPTSDVLNEAVNQARVYEAGVKIPKILDIKLLETGEWTIEMEYIKGKTLADLMTKDPANLDKYLNQFADIQISIHQFRVPLLNKLKDKMARKINETTFSATKRYELNMILEGMPKHNKLCHGDLTPSNIIIDEKGDAYIIDWAHATQGNASADIARTYLMFAIHNSEELANKYLDVVCNKADIAKQLVQHWLPIVAASQSVKGNKEEVELLSRWTSVVAYE